MPALNDVTLVCVDDLDPGAALRMLRWQVREVQPAAAVLFTSHDIDVPPRWPVRIVPCQPIRSLDDYSLFMVRSLARYVHPGIIGTDHVLVVQRDGYVVRPELWDPVWLRYDYIGASWKGMVQHHIERGMEVGNGGFSLRSVHFLRAGNRLARSLRERGPIIEDAYLCRHHRRWMEAHGIRYAPLEVAMRFSTESPTYRGEFGYHRSVGPPRGLPSGARQSSWNG
jgi:hypothetical protein